MIGFGGGEPEVLRGVSLRSLLIRIWLLVCLQAKRFNSSSHSHFRHFKALGNFRNLPNSCFPQTRHFLSNWIVFDQQIWHRIKDRGEVLAILSLRLEQGLPRPV